MLWFDALVGNVDRSWRNANLLFWHGGPYLIDHGATLTFHHAWSGADGLGDAARTTAADHVLLPADPDLDAADAELARGVTEPLLRSVVELVPDAWLADEPGFAGPDAVRAAYVEQLLARLGARAEWLPGVRAAVAARGSSDRPPGRRTRRPG